MTPSRVLKLTIGLSALTHALLYFALGWTWLSPRGAGPAGTVSVDFIEAVVHSSEPGSARAVRTVPTRPRSGPRPAARSTPEDIGKTHAEAAPTDARPPEPPSTPGGSGGAGGATNDYVAEVGRLINQRKQYPRSALTRELEGRVVVAITLGRDGELLDSAVEAPCPFAVLNEAALAAVRGVRRYPASAVAAGPTLHLHVPIVFKITR